jgi:glycosyltransferase involved in cell wall biosynthesis
MLQQGLEGNVYLLGERQDVHAILNACDIGVLSSVSEGLPLALLEYGMAALAAVATHVGQCAEVLDEGRAGILVPSASPERLAHALLSLLKSPARSLALGKELQRRVQERYSAGAVMKQVCQIYEKVLSAL